MNTKQLSDFLAITLNDQTAQEKMHETIQNQVCKLVGINTVLIYLMLAIESVLTKIKNIMEEK